MHNAMKLRAGVILLIAGTAFGATQESFGLMPPDAPQAVVRAANRFESIHPGTGIYWTGVQPTTLYGKSFSRGASPEASSQAFIHENLALLGVRPEQLTPGSLATDRAAVRMIMPDADTGQMKFTVISYLQQVDGIPVFRGELKLVVRNEPGYPLVLAKSSLRNLGVFRIRAAEADPNLSAVFASVGERMAGVTDWGTPELVVWAGLNGAEVTPRLAVKLTATAGNPSDEGYARRTLLADAATGQILHEEDQVQHVDVAGTVSGMATTGTKSAACNPEALAPMKYGRVGIGTNFVFADGTGNFTIPNAGAGQVTVTAQCRGRYFRVFNPLNDAPSVTVSVTPPGPANLVLNAANTSPLRLAEVNAYVQANVARDFLLTYAPTHPVIPTQEEFRVNTGVAGTCNAFYDGTSINFFNAGGGCTNSAFADIVWHEYGHHIVSTAGSGQDAYGEGFGDLFALLISDEPVIGSGLYLNCQKGVRTASNIFRYPCSDPDPHWCGQLLSGCFWETRNELALVDPSGYRDTLASLACNSVILHNGGDTSIDPQITIDVLTLDDDDADIGNGTPHYAQIETGFGSRHGMHAPPLELLAFSYPDGRPALVDPAGTTTLHVQIDPLGGSLQEGSVALMIDSQGNGSFTAVPAIPTGGGSFTAAFPEIPCATHLRYYVTAQTTGGQAVADTASMTSALAAAESVTVFDDNFQSDQGWTTSVIGATGGAWQRGVPVGGGFRGDPLADSDGSGACFLTENVAGNSDVDGGTVQLTSPLLDASAGEAFLSYSRWYDNTGAGTGDGAYADVFVVELSNDGGATWSTLETVGPVADSWGGWVRRTFKLSSTLPLTSTMKVRFTAGDLGAASIVEAAVDDVSLEIVTRCTPCTTDFDGSGFLDIEDYTAFVLAFEAGLDDADFDGSGFVDLEDFDAFVKAFEIGC